MSEESPILFAGLSEDFDDTDDAVADNGLDRRSQLGAWIKTVRSNEHNEHDEEENRFVHSVNRLDPSKTHQLFEDLVDGDELRCVNNLDVRSWSHDTLMQTINNLDSEIITFIFYQKSRQNLEMDLVETDETFIQIEFLIDNLGSDSKGTIGDISHTIKKISMKILNKITISPRLHLLKSNGTSDVKIEHGAIRHDYMMVNKDKPVMTTIKDSDDADKFTAYVFEALEDQDLTFVAAFQWKANKKFLMCNATSKKLSLVKDDDITENMSDIRSNSPCLFSLSTSGDGNGFYIESVAYPGSFLTYDTIDQLQVARFNEPPYSDKFRENDCVKRNCVFDLVGLSSSTGVIYNRAQN